MKDTTATSSVFKKGHVCPPSNATHPKDRWESLFVYSFICKFTNLRAKVDELNSPMDFEQALLASEANPVMNAILLKFVQNLRPQTRNTESVKIAGTVASVLQDFFKTNERSVFWDDEQNKNMDPFTSREAQWLWTSDWDFKLKVLRQLIELQLCHSTEIKSIIDRAWGIVHNKHKKIEQTAPPPPPEDPFSLFNLSLLPLGQDFQRKRYWVIDDSPRVYLSTNPWKITATFEALSSTKEEYIALIEKLKESGPGLKEGGKRTKTEQGHFALISALEGRIPDIDAELARIERARKKLAQKNLLIAQAELRETRTRRRTTRPDYAYLDDPTIEDDGGEYKDQEDDDYNDDFTGTDDDTRNGASSTRKSALAVATRRSTRSTRTNTMAKEVADEWGEWRGERRSARLGAPSETQLDGPPPKRARTDDSTTSSVEPQPVDGKRSLRLKANGAAAPKPTETIVESVAGKKKSKFWVYAVEPIVSAQDGQAQVDGPPQSSSMDYEMSDGAGPSTTDSYRNDEENGSSAEVRTNGGSSYAQSVERSSSPASTMDES